MPVIKAEAEEHVRLFQLAKVGTLQQVLMFLDCPANLPLLSIQIAEDQVNLERIARRFGGGAQLLDCRIDLIRDEEIEAEHVVRRLARAAAVNPSSILQFVPLPRFADGEAGKESDEEKQGDVSSHQAVCVYSRITASHRCCARSTTSTNSRAAPRPPAAPLTQSTCSRTSAAASAG